MNDDEYPRWEFHGGNGKNRKWRSYIREHCELLEAAFELRVGRVAFTIDDWAYEVDLVNMSQTSLTTSAIRLVRRLTGPPAM